MNSNHYKRTKISCYYTYLAVSSVFSLPPLLFITFREMYGISYTLLGTLVSVNFCTQLAVDLIFSFFTKHFNIHKTIKIMPLLTSFGLLIYALVPLFFPQYAYIGFLIGTVIFALAAGLCEVLLSPLVAAIPSDNPKRDMSTLHSLYAYGVVSVIVVSTVFLKIFGTERWMYLTLFFALLPIISFILFCTSPLPEMNISNEKSSNGTKRKNFALILFAFCILLGGAAENTMTNWISTYMERRDSNTESMGRYRRYGCFCRIDRAWKNRLCKIRKKYLKSIGFRNDRFSNLLFACCRCIECRSFYNRLYFDRFNNLHALAGYAYYDGGKNPQSRCNRLCAYGGGRGFRKLCRSANARRYCGFGFGK